MLDKRIHKVDLKPHGSVEVTVKLPEDTKIKMKPQVLPKPKPETCLALGSPPAAARQVIITYELLLSILDHKFPDAGFF